MIESIESEWQKIITNFRSSVQTAIENTEELVNEGWEKAVKCEEEHPCCAFNAVEWENMQTKISNLIRLHVERTEQLDILQIRITHMKEQCAPPEWEIDWESFDEKAT